MKKIILRDLLDVLCLDNGRSVVINKFYIDYGVSEFAGTFYLNEFGGCSNFVYDFDNKLLDCSVVCIDKDALGSFVIEVESYDTWKYAVIEGV